MIHRTVRSASLLGFADLARRHGADPDAIAAAHGVSPAALVNPDLRVPFVAVTSMYADAAEQTGLEDFGLRVAMGRRAAVWGMTAVVAREQPTVGAALQAIRRFARLQSEGSWIALEDAGDLVEVQLNFYEALPARALRVSIDVGLATFAQVLREVAGEAWRPLGVCFRYGRPASLVLHRTVFGVDALFDQAFDGFICHRDALDLPLAKADVALAPQVSRLAEGLLQNYRASLADEVMEAVVRLLPEGRCDREEVARMLGIGLRTLQRRLADEGTNFATLLDQGREILCQSYVDGSPRSLAEVAELLGFSSQQSFNHWYRDRFGETPSARRKHVQSRRP